VRGPSYKNGVKDEENLRFQGISLKNAKMTLQLLRALFTET
jgi:hypothetical protein